LNRRVIEFLDVHLQGCQRERVERQDVLSETATPADTSGIWLISVDK